MFKQTNNAQSDDSDKSDHKLYVSYVDNLTLIKQNISLYCPGIIFESDTYEGYDLSTWRSLLMAILKCNYETWQYDVEVLRSKCNILWKKKDDALLCLLHCNMRTSEDLLQKYVDQIESAKDPVQEKKEALQKLKTETKNSLLTENQRNNFEFAEKENTIKFQLAGSQLRKLIHNSLPLLQAYFNTEAKRKSTKYGQCFENWKKLFKSYDEIMYKLADRQKKWNMTDIETLRIEIDSFADLYIFMFGTEKVTIYFYMLFSGVILQQLRIFGNIARYDGNTIERFHKTYKGYIHWCTNQWDIALDTFLYFAVRHVYWVETAGKDGKISGEFPSGEGFQNRYQEVLQMSKAAKKQYMRDIDDDRTNRLALEIDTAAATGTELELDTARAIEKDWIDDDDDGDDFDDNPLNGVDVPGDHYGGGGGGRKKQKKS